MSLFDKIFTRHPKSEDGQTWLTLNGYDTAAFHKWSGNAFESDIVRASVDARARHISKLMISINGNGKPTLSKKLLQRPNAWQTWSQFLYRLSVVLDLNCTAFIAPVYSQTFDIEGLCVVIPQEYELVNVGGEAWIRLRFANGNIASDKLTNFGIMTKYQYMSDYFGTGNSALDATLELIDIQRQGIQAAAENSATYRFMATLGNFAKPEDLAKERERFTKENLKSDVGGGLLLFPSTYKDVKEITNKQYSVNADEQKAIQDRVFNYFGVNDKILNNSAKADDLDAFYEGAIEPFAVQLADVVTGMIYTPNEQTYGDRVEFSTDRLSYMTTQAKIQLIRDMSDRGELTKNEGRKLLGLPPLADGDATILRGEYYTTQYDKDGNVVYSEKHTDKATDGEETNNGE